MIQEELDRLAHRFPDLAEWDAAFRQAAWANILRLSYVVKVLEGRAERRAAPPGSPIGDGRPPARPANRAPRPQPPRGREAYGGYRDPIPDREERMAAIYAAQERASKVKPVDWRKVLGVEHA